MPCASLEFVDRMSLCYNLIKHSSISNEVVSPCELCINKVDKKCEQPIASHVEVLAEQNSSKSIVIVERCKFHKEP